MRIVLMGAALATMAALAAPAWASQQWTVTAGLGEYISSDYQKVVGCHPGSGELTIRNEYGHGGFAVRMRVGDSLWGVLNIGNWSNWSSVSGSIVLDKVEHCVGTFTLIPSDK